MSTFIQRHRAPATALLGFVALLVAIGSLWVLGVISVPVAQIRTFVNDATSIVVAVVMEAIPFAVIIGVLLLSTWALRRHFALRTRDLDLRSQGNDIEMARLQGDLVVSLRLHLQQITPEHPDEAAQIRLELNDAIERYQAVLLGILRGRPELARVEREAIASYLAEAEAEFKRLNVTGAPS